MDSNFSLKDKIFIAGSNGMVGSAIYRNLIKKGYGKSNVGGQILCPKREELNLLNSQEVKEWFSKNKPDIVIVAAAKVGGILANNTFPADFLLENLKIQVNVIENSHLFGAKRLLFLGSSCIYPKFSRQPIKEDYLLNGNLEKTNEWYAIAKISGIKLCESLRRQYGFDAISVMPTNLYGKGDNYDYQTSHVMASLIRKFSEAKKHNLQNVTCWGTGEPLREFLHVDDLADALTFLLEEWKPESPSSPRKDNGELLSYLNIGTGKDISIKELAEKIAFLIDYKGEISWDKSKPDGTPKKQLDNTRINQLGWYPKISLNEGIKKTIKDFNDLKI